MVIQEESAKKTLQKKVTKQATEFLEIQAGKVRVSDGSVVDRSDVVFSLQQSSSHKNVYKAKDGVIYVKMKDGSLRRISPKKSELRKKTSNEEHRNSEGS